MVQSPPLVMSEHRVELTLEGFASEDGHVRLQDFLTELNRLSSALHQTDRLVTGSRRSTSYYRIVDMRHSSPATVVLEARPRSKARDERSRVLGGFFGALDQIRDEGTAPEWVSRQLLEDLKGIAKPVGKSVRAATVSNSDKRFEFSKELEARIGLILAPEEEYEGSIEGDLEAINLHGGANVFRIYPDFGPKRVSCHFPSELEEEAVTAVTKYVSVRGTLRYKGAAEFPYAIEVQEIEVLPTDEELPSLSDLRGIAPGATGNLSSEEFVRQLRDEWS